MTAVQVSVAVDFRCCALADCFDQVVLSESPGSHQDVCHICSFRISARIWFMCCYQAQAFIGCSWFCLG